MFTGLIECVGRVVAIDPRDYGRRLLIDPGDWGYAPEPGASIAVDGCCLTYAPAPADPETFAGKAPGRLLGFDVVQQTLARTTLGDLKPGDRVNLEACLTPTSRLGGHFVQGHVDGRGHVARIETADGHRITVRVPEELMPYIAPTGSIAVNGVSLTVAHVDVPGCTFSVALIPTTLQLTNMGDLAEDDAVNLEVDLLVKSAVHYLRHFAPELGGGADRAGGAS